MFQYDNYIILWRQPDDQPISNCETFAYCHLRPKSEKDNQT